MLCCTLAAELLLPSLWGNPPKGKGVTVLYTLTQMFQQIRAFLFHRTCREVTRDWALEQLERILVSAHFRTSKRCSQFLRYVVEHAGNDPVELKELTLGVEAFGRDAHYDTHQDPVVRITAGEVRKRLAQYYQESGHEGELRITLPPGSYVPEFHQPAPQVEPEPVVLTEVVQPVVDSKSNPRAWMLGVAAVAAVVLAGSVWLLHPTLRMQRRRTI